MMFPVLSIPYFVDCDEAYAKLLRHFGTAHLASKFFNLRNLIGCQLGEVGLLSNVKRRLRLSQELNSMTMVLATSNYFEILSSCVMPYPVFVVDFHPIWDWADKGRSDEAVNPFWASLLAKAHAWIARIITASFHDSLEALHSSLVADLISGESLNRLPFFCHVGLLFRCFGSTPGFMEAA